jgi:hypothetical protein
LKDGDIFEQKSPKILSELTAIRFWSVLYLAQAIFEVTNEVSICITLLKTVPM